MAPEFRPDRILRVLEQHDVRFVLIGGLAATAHGSPQVTNDVDITPERSRENLHRLSAALKELGARIRTAAEPEGFPFDHDAESLDRLEKQVLRQKSRWRVKNRHTRPVAARSIRTLAAKPERAA